ncbi:MAG: hypothetical protein IPI60_09510 [Saprospiraceae bacterium]|nr:hypothetical protein [Saprospiraceae bacterium]
MKQLLLNFSMILLCIAAINVNQAGATTCPQATTVSAIPYNASLVCTGTNDITSTNATVCAPASSLYYGGQEALLVYTPAANVAVDISINGRSWTGIMVYAGCPTSGGTCLGGISSSLIAKSLTNVALTGGTTYYIMVDTWPTPDSPCSGSGTTISIGVHVPPPPPPGCSTATAVTCGVPVVGTTVGGQLAPNLGTCTTALNTAVGKWYTVYGGGGNITASLCTGTAYDSKIGVFSGTCGTLVCVGGNDDGCGAQSTVTWNAVNGTLYYIYVTGFSTATGAFTLNVTGTCGAPPPPPVPGNDTCANATAITCGSTTNGTTLGATSDTAPTCDVTTTAPGVWYTIQGDGDIFTLTACGNSLDPKLSVYTGTCGALVCLEGNQASCSEVEFLSVAGTTYRVFVHGNGASVGTFSLAASCVPLCPSPIDAPWTVTAIGGAVGTAIENCDETFTVSTTGVGTATADKIHFVHQNLTGNGYVVADINTFTSFTFGGVQFRDGLTAGARKVDYNLSWVQELHVNCVLSQMALTLFHS